MPDTPPPLTDEQLAAIRAREAAATRGPWWNDSTEIYASEWPGVPSMCTWVGETCNIDLPDRGDANGAFLAHARQDVLALLAELDRLRAERDQFADRVDTLTAVAKSNKRAYRILAEDNQRLAAQLAQRDDAIRETADRILQRGPQLVQQRDQVLTEAAQLALATPSGHSLCHKDVAAHILGARTAPDAP